MNHHNHRTGRFKRNCAALLITLALVGCSSPGEEAQKYYERGMALLDEGDLVKARLEFQNALQIVNTMTDAAYGLALIAEKQGEWERLYGLLNRVLDQDPKHLQAHIKLGRLMLASGEIERALKLGQSAAEISPGSADVLALQGAVLFKLDDRKGAVEHANAALAKEAEHVDALVLLATERLSADDPQKAIEYLDRALNESERNIALHLIKVQALQQMSNNEAAEGVFRKLIAFYPEHRPLRHALAQFHMTHGARDKAEAEFRAVVMENPNDAKAKLDLVGFLSVVDGQKASIQALQAFIQAEPSNNELKFALAGLLQSGAEGEAAEEVLRSIAASGVEADALKAKGLVAAARLTAGDRAAATELVSEILDKDERNEQGLFLRASMALDERKTDGAIADLRTILRDAPQSARTLLLLGKAHEQANAPELAEDHYARALQASKFAGPYGVAYAEFLTGRRDLARAEQVLQNVIGMHPNDRNAMKTLADVRLRRGDWVGAQEVADQLRALGDEDQISERIVGAVQAGKKNYDASIASFKRAYEASPNAVQPIVSLVRTYLAAGKTDEAMSFLKTLVERNPDNLNARLLQGQLYIALGRSEAAVSAFQGVIDAAPKNVLGYRNLANLHLRDARMGEAEKVIAEGLAIAPTDFGLRLTQASAHEKAGRFEDAIGLYEQMLSEQPNADVIANNLASLLSDHREDKASLERAYDLARRFEHSNVPYFKETLGWASHRVGRHHQAAELLTSAAKELPDLAVVRYHMGMNYLALSEVDAARKELERALEMGEKAPFPQAEKAREALARL